LYMFLACFSPRRRVGEWIFSSMDS